MQRNTSGTQGADYMADFRARLDGIEREYRDHLQHDLEVIAGDIPADLMQYAQWTPDDLRASAADFDLRTSSLWQNTGSARMEQSISDFSQRLDQISKGYQPVAGKTQLSTAPLASTHKHAPTLEKAWQLLDAEFYTKCHVQPTPNQRLAPRVEYITRHSELVSVLTTQLKLNRNGKEALSQGIGKLAKPPLCLYLPAYGCVINGPAVGAFDSVTDAWADEKARRKLYRELAQQRLGRGYILEYTRLGAELQRKGWWKIDTCRALGINPADVDISDAHVKRWDMLSAASRFTRSGWRSHSKQFAEPYEDQSIEFIFASFNQLVECMLFIMGGVVGIPAQLVLRVVMGVLKLAMSANRDLITANPLNDYVSLLHRCNTAFHDIFARMNYEPMGAAIGRLMLHKVGLCVAQRDQVDPILAGAVALALAGSDALFEQDEQEIASTLKSQPRSNPDTRLLMLSMFSDRQLNSVNDLARALER